MSNQLRKIERNMDANLRKSWLAWIATVRSLPLGQRLTIAYKIVPGLRIAAQLSVMLVIVVIALIAVLTGAPIDWPDFGIN